MAKKSNVITHLKRTLCIRLDPTDVLDCTLDLEMVKSITAMTTKPQTNDEGSTQNYRQRSANSPPPALLVTEILEMIIEHLPPEDLLLRAQLVSHQWHSVIWHSPGIKQKLFYNPDIRCAEDSSGRQLRHIHQWLGWDHASGQWVPTTNIEINLFFERIIIRHDIRFLRRLWQCADDNASWKNMYICDPPATSIHLQTKHLKVMVREAIGLQMKHIIPLMLPLLMNKNAVGGLRDGERQLQELRNFSIPGVEEWKLE